MRRAAAAILAACVLSACGGGGASTSREALSATVSRLTTARAPASAGRGVRPATCPTPAPTRSSPLVDGTKLAPGDPVWTTVCVYVPSRHRGRPASPRRRVYRGGPLDALLNGTSWPPDAACAGTATPPIVALLTYRTGITRRAVIDLGGCSVIASDGSTRQLPASGNWGLLGAVAAGGG